MSQLLHVKHRLVLRLSEAERQTLEEGARHHPHADARERCAALLKVADGHSPHWIAKQGLLVSRHPDVVYHWVYWYQEEGIAFLTCHRHGGPRRRRLRCG